MAALREQFDQDGYALAEGLFSVEECEAYSKYFTEMVERGGDGYAETWLNLESDDPLVRYPRLLQPHRSNQVAFDFMIEPRIAQILTLLCGKPPLAVQTMVYFKPPGARGQALHQDQRYLKVDPGTCIAAWLALDDCDEENGCMYVVPGTHNIPILCPVASDPEQSWTGEMVPVPPGMSVVPVIMKRGDVLFFNGQLIHGSSKNNSATRFRRTLIGHYIDGDAKSVGEYYFPIWDLEGNEVSERLSSNPEGSPCGVIREDESGFRYDFSGTVESATAAH